ncbi:MAG: hypothetical protein M0Q49_06440 [Porticoccaceae bacterium]|nr:hypothetical protein [Porticoccaceae bacterium]
MISKLIERLASVGTGYQTIDHAWDINLIESIRDVMPAAYFMPGPANSEPSQQLPIRQLMLARVVVVTVCDWAALQELLDQLYPALIGYQHAADYTELEHVQGDVLAIKERVVWWRDTFSAGRYINALTPPPPSVITSAGGALMDGNSHVLTTQS